MSRLRGICGATGLAAKAACDSPPPAPPFLLQHTETIQKPWRLCTYLWLKSPGRDRVAAVPYLVAIRVGQVPCVKDEVDGWLVSENPVQRVPGVGKAGFQCSAVQRPAEHVLFKSSARCLDSELGTVPKRLLGDADGAGHVLGTTSTMNVRDAKKHVASANRKGLES